MEVGKISEGIAATIELLESIPVRGLDIEVVGFGLLTAIKNLKTINQAVIKAENGEPFIQEEENTIPDIQPAQMDVELEDGDRA